MKKIILLSAFLVSVTSHAALEIRQTHTSDYYQMAHVFNHLEPVESYFSAALKKYDCLGGKLSYKILKKYKPSFFGIGEPGSIEFSYEAYCKSADLIDFRYSFAPAGFDEDYSEVNVQITTLKGATNKRFCLYATRQQYLECPF